MTPRSKLSRDRGAADPMLTLGAIAVSLIIASSIVAAIISIIQLGTGFMAEQQAATELSQARDAFARDADAASGVKVSDTGPGGSITFYETPNGAAIATPRSVTGCRIAKWSVHPYETGRGFELEGRVWKTNDPTCKSDPPVADKGTPVFKVTGLTAAPTLTVVNAAGRTVVFNAGKAAAPTGTKPSSYFTDVEWTSTIPKTLTWFGPTELTISGKREAQLSGVTHLGEGHAITPPGTIVEPRPTAVTYDPAPSKPTVTRGGLKKSIKGGLSESIHITWPQVYCGPYTVRYEVSYKSSTRGVTRPVTSITTYDASALVADLDGVANGEVGTVEVRTSCPATVSSKPATAATPYTQPLPKPTLTASRLTDSAHRLTWSTDLSTLKLTFQPQGKHSTESSFYLPSPTGDAGMTWNWPVGASFGMSQYAVKASVAGGGTSPLSDIATVTIAWPATPVTKPWSYNAGGTIHDNAVGWPAAYCPAGTAIDYNPVVSGTARGWRTSLSLGVSVNYSTTYSAAVQTRCHSPYEVSKTAVGPTIYWTTNAAPPAAPQVSSTVTWTRMCDGGFIGLASWSRSANASSYQVQYLYRDADGRSSGWISAGSTTGTSVSFSESGTAVSLLGNAFRVRAVGAGGTSGWSVGSPIFRAGCF